MNLPKPKEIIIIYHADCIDGYGAAWSVFMKYGNQVKYVPARFGESFPKHNENCEIYILDFSYSPDIILDVAKTVKHLTLIDHHVTAMKQFENVPMPENVTMHFDMNHSGCVLAWQHFFPDLEVPIILQHIEDRDLWRFQLAGTQEITTAIYEKMPLSFKAFGSLNLKSLFSVGRIQVAQMARMVKRLARYAHPIKIGNASGLAVNAGPCFSSDLGHLLAEKSNGVGMVYYYDGDKLRWIYSLRSIGDLDVGALAVEYGGGGHVNAAGFSLSYNPFLPM
jgi:oligoribonuclease NrnB/cAMP/cGMP phosphodiesterase (DHH superfamily)